LLNAAVAIRKERYVRVAFVFYVTGKSAGKNCALTALCPYSSKLGPAFITRELTATFSPVLAKRSRCCDDPLGLLSLTFSDWSLNLKMMYVKWFRGIHAYSRMRATGLLMTSKSVQNPG
jgi:hypothetical protein